MLRVFYIIIVSLPIVVFFFFKVHDIKKHEGKYTEAQRYDYAQYFIRKLKKNGHIFTDVYGCENLPQEGGYVMYANHQGKFDALGIIDAHGTPCTFVMDAIRSKLPFASQFVDLLSAVRLDKSSMKNQVAGINRVIKEVTGGRRYIIFPEGGYDHNHNEVKQFLPGAFKCSIKSKSPIVPVALIDTYKAFEFNSLRKVKAQIHFLKPLLYEEYKDMSSIQIATVVRERIRNLIAEKTAV